LHEALTLGLASGENGTRRQAPFATHGFCRVARDTLRAPSWVWRFRCFPQAHWHMLEQVGWGGCPFNSSFPWSLSLSFPASCSFARPILSLPLPFLVVPSQFVVGRQRGMGPLLGGGVHQRAAQFGEGGLVLHRAGSQDGFWDSGAWWGLHNHICFVNFECIP
jgi:hypothetical protein